MTHLTPEAKEAIIQRALLRGNKPLQQIALESNIGYSTLQKWLSQKKKDFPTFSQRRGRPPKGQGQTPPLQHLLATAGLDEESVSIYCREQGIHSFQLKQWQNELMTNDTTKKQSDNLLKELKILRNENKHLKKDLQRKDKALAETSALLILKKKADLIWGEHEDV